MTADPLTVFRARGLGKTYRAGDVAVVALRDVDLDIVAGEFMVLLGPSGSGKSTLLNILGGLEVASTGSLTYLDHDLVAANDDQLTRYRRDQAASSSAWPSRVPSSSGPEVFLCDEPPVRSTTPQASNGRHRRLRIVGIGLSPEFVFAGLWGMPDQRGFGVFWIDQAGARRRLRHGGRLQHAGGAPGTCRGAAGLPTT